DPIVVTLWDTSWAFSKYDMKFLKDPKKVFAPSETYYWIGHKGFSEKHPDIREAIASVFVPFSAIQDISVMINDGMSMEDAVNDWLQNHQERVSHWGNIKTD